MRPEGRTPVALPKLTTTSKSGVDGRAMITISQPIVVSLIGSSGSECSIWGSDAHSEWSKTRRLSALLDLACDFAYRLVTSARDPIGSSLLMPSHAGRTRAFLHKARTAVRGRFRQSRWSLDSSPYAGAKLPVRVAQSHGRQLISNRDVAIRTRARP